MFRAILIGCGVVGAILFSTATSHAQYTRAELPQVISYYNSVAQQYCGRSGAQNQQVCATARQAIAYYTQMLQNMGGPAPPTSPSSGGGTTNPGSGFGGGTYNPPQCGAGSMSYPVFKVRVQGYIADPRTRLLQPVNAFLNDNYCNRASANTAGNNFVAQLRRQSPTSAVQVSAEVVGYVTWRTGCASDTALTCGPNGVAQLVPANRAGSAP